MQNSLIESMVHSIFALVLCKSFFCLFQRDIFVLVEKKKIKIPSLNIKPTKLCPTIQTHFKMLKLIKKYFYINNGSHDYLHMKRIVVINLKRINTWSLNVF